MGSSSGRSRPLQRGSRPDPYLLQAVRSPPGHDRMSPPHPQSWQRQRPESSSPPEPPEPPSCSSKKRGPPSQLHKEKRINTTIQKEEKQENELRIEILRRIERVI